MTHPDDGHEIRRLLNQRPSNHRKGREAFKTLGHASNQPWLRQHDAKALDTKPLAASKAAVAPWQRRRAARPRHDSSATSCIGI